MFKKSLLALALAGVALTGAVNAADLTASDIQVSKEGNAANGSDAVTQVEIADIAIDVGVDYIVNDIVQFTVSGAKFDTDVNGAITVTDTSSNGSVLTFVDFSNDNTVRFRVSVADTGAADTLTLSTFALDLSDTAAGTDVTISSQAISVNPLIGAYDKSDGETDLIEVRAQTSIEATVALNGEVSTAAGRAEFTGGLTDVLTVTLTDNEADVDGLSFDELTHTIVGDFSFLMDYDLDANGGDDSGDLDDGEIAAGIVYTSVNVGGQDTVEYSIDDALTTVTAVQTVDGGSDLDLVNTFTITVVGDDADGSVITAPQSFTYASSTTDGTNAVADSAISAGAFTLDGSSTDIAFLPFGSDYAQSITVTNDTAIEGAITVTLTAGGMDYSKELVAIASAKSVTNISKEVAAFAVESGVTGDAQVNVTVNAPTITVKGLYYHKPSQDRVLTQ
ncbi:MAG: hypothetical protein OCD00_07040 [Colwellia sp.]